MVRSDHHRYGSHGPETEKAGADEVEEILNPAGRDQADRLRHHRQRLRILYPSPTD